MKYLLGIDQGGTKTITLVCDVNGKILGTGFDSGLVDIYFKDTEELYIKRIVNASENACRQANITLEQVGAVCGGINGADWDFEYPLLTGKLSQALNKNNVTVLNDCIVAMRGGSRNPECAVVCAGTGLNAAVRRSDGEEIIYGYFIDGAHQGGSALGTQALRKVMESYLGICGNTSLTELVLGYTGHNCAESLLIDITSDKYKLEPKDLTPLLLKAFAAGDNETSEFVGCFADGVAKYITAGMKRLDMSGKALDIVFSGSVFKDIGMLVADLIFDYIVKAEPNVRKIYAKYEPVCGAAMVLLDREWGEGLPDEVEARFYEGAKAHGLLRDLSVTAN